MTTILEKTTGLIAFVRTIESGSFSAASRLVGSSQSAISKSVAALERRLGVKLIQRSTRTLSLTAEGQAYYERVAPLLRAIEDAEDVVQAAATPRGPIRVAAPQELGRMLIAPWAATFLDRYPEVSLELGISDRFVDIIREGFDIAIRMGSLADSDLVSRKIGDIRFVLAASPDYISRNSVPADLESLGRHVFVRYAASGRPWPYILADGARLPTSGTFRDRRHRLDPGSRHMRRRDRIPASCRGRAGFCRGTTGRAPPGSQAPNNAGLRGACLRSPTPRAGEALHRFPGRTDRGAVVLSDPNASDPNASDPNGWPLQEGRWC
jgi:DNA-binding transcriptional LysR family regulator